MLDRDKIDVCTHFDRSKQGVNQFFIKIKLRESDLLHLPKRRLRMLVAKRFCTRALYTELLVEILVIVFLFFCLSFLPPSLFLFVMSFFLSFTFQFSLFFCRFVMRHYLFIVLSANLSVRVEDKNSFWHKHISCLFEKIVMSVKRKMKEKEFSNFLNMSLSFLSRRFQRDVTERVCLVLKIFVSSVSSLSCLFCFFLSQKKKHNFLLENWPIKWIFRKCSWIFYSLFFYLSNYLCMAFFFSI